jgi:enterochelin esterase-like enzyme
MIIMKNIAIFSLFVLIILGVVIYPLSNAPVSQAATFVADDGVPTLQTTVSQADLKVTTVPTVKSRPTSRPTSDSVLPEGPRAAVQLSPTARPTAAVVQTITALPELPVKLDTMVIFSKNLDGAERVAQVYLPGEYAQNPTKRYPVLYALDGQQLPEIGFAQTLNELFAAREMAPVIVVAVHSTEGDLRREELGAGKNINLFGWGTLSEAFNQFMVSELVPKVNSSYRTLAGAQNTAIMGWSLGGLSSFYLAWQYSETFGMVGAFSPSFWWRTASQPGEELQARVILNLVAAGDKRPGLRMWFEAGTKELPYSDVDGNGEIDMIQDVQDVMKLLVQKGYQTNTDLVYVEVPGGLHELTTWETVLPDFLRFAFPVK